MYAAVERRCDHCGRAPVDAFVGQRDLAVTANTYSHVLIDEDEVEYAELLAA
jgi:hypothetical protein